MPDSQVSFQLCQCAFFEYFMHQSHAFVHIHIPFGANGIAYGDPAGFLSPVLEGSQAITDRACRLLSVRVENSEYAACFLDSFCCCLIHGSFPYSENRSWS